MNMHEMDQEMKLLRGQILDERNKRESFINEQNMLINQL